MIRLPHDATCLACFDHGPLKLWQAAVPEDACCNHAWHVQSAASHPFRVQPSARQRSFPRERLDAQRDAPGDCQCKDSCGRLFRILRSAMLNLSGKVHLWLLGIRFCNKGFADAVLMKASEFTGSSALTRRCCQRIQTMRSSASPSLRYKACSFVPVASCEMSMLQHTSAGVNKEPMQQRMQHRDIEVNLTVLLGLERFQSVRDLAMT